MPREINLTKFRKKPIFASLPYSGFFNTIEKFYEDGQSVSTTTSGADTLAFVTENFTENVKFLDFYEDYIGIKHTGHYLVCSSVRVIPNTDSCSIPQIWYQNLNVINEEKVLMSTGQSCCQFCSWQEDTLFTCGVYNLNSAEFLNVDSSVKLQDFIHFQPDSSRFFHDQTHLIFNFRLFSCNF
ncbi:uncharacterized protein LOC131957911 [Physella acuta]|uniref:uncharacterized protein LOC131957911 n=1 Tax=Physella acuta TaxID=109671 RepID=UPI0027DC7C51|nr:uncharacterized protein LOC131957911 [Physella acuta]